MNHFLKKNQKPALFPVPAIFLLLMFLVSSSYSGSIEEKVKEFTLENGMKFIFMERHDVPVFSAVYGYKVGSVDEPTTLTGLSHLLEHMAFKGTPRIGTIDYGKEKPIIDEINRFGTELSYELMKGEFADQEKIMKLKGRISELEEEQMRYFVPNEIMDIYQKAGGAGVNAGTSIDITIFTVNLPSTELELWCLIESERMKEPVFRGFHKEREVIQQERKKVVEGNPLSRLREVFQATAFTAHPYRNPVVGWPSDIESITIEEAKAFKKKYHSPNNCVAVLVGDIHSDKAIPLIKKYFEGIPRGPEIHSLRTIEPRQFVEKRLTMESEKNPSLMIAFHKPTFPHKDAYAMNLVAMILSNGKLARMQNDLIQERQLASMISCDSNFPGQRYDNLFLISANPRLPHTNEELEEAIYEHLERLKNEPVKQEELQKVSRMLEYSYAASLKDNFGIAHQLLTNEFYQGSWRKISAWQEEISKITPEDIMGVAKRYFHRENRTVAFLVSKQKKDN